MSEEPLWWGLGVFYLGSARAEVFERGFESVEHSPVRFRGSPIRFVQCSV